MLPLITAALGLVQQNQQKQEDRKKQMEAAAMGQFANAPGPQSGGNAGALAGIGSAIGGMMGGSSAPSGPIVDKSIGEMSPMSPGVQATGGPMDNDADERGGPLDNDRDDDLLRKLGQSRSMIG